MKDPFKGFIIATAGDFGRQRTSEHIKRWIEANGGRYVTKVDENVTHLICSAEHWKSQSSMGKFGDVQVECVSCLLTRRTVQAAIRYPKKIKVVTYDWLEDSLMSKIRKREGDYLIKKHVKADRRKKNAAKRQEQSALKKEGKLFTPISRRSLCSETISFFLSSLIIFVFQSAALIVVAKQR